MSLFPWRKSKKIRVAENVLMVYAIGQSIIKEHPKEVGEQIVMILSAGMRQGHVNDQLLEHTFNERPPFVQNCIIAMAFYELEVETPYESKEWYQPNNPLDRSIYDDAVLLKKNLEFHKKFGRKIPEFYLSLQAKRKRGEYRIYHYADEDVYKIHRRPQVLPKRR